MWNLAVAAFVVWGLSMPPVIADLEIDESAGVFLPENTTGTGYSRVESSDADEDRIEASYVVRPIPTREFPSFHVRAQIDGDSDLVVKGSTLHWHHLQWAAPGRHGGTDNPTFINGIPWTPEWPEEGENRNCDCDSSEFLNLSPLLPRGPVTPMVIPYQGRNTVKLKQAPTAENDFTLIVTFNDPYGGSTWYDAAIGWIPAGDARAKSFAEKSIHVRAFIDGESHLVMKGSSLHWRHLDGNPPGRQEEGNDLPTFVSGKTWRPDWPDATASMKKRLDSSGFTGFSPALPESAVLVAVIKQQARGPVMVKQQPNPANDFTLVVAFDDRMHDGAEWYNVSITWSGIGTPSGEDLISTAFQLSAGEFQRVKAMMTEATPVDGPDLDVRKILRGEQEEPVPGREIFLFQDTRVFVLRDTESNIGRIESWLEKLRTAPEVESATETAANPE